MGRHHCEEFEEILISKPPLLERYGIIIIMFLFMLVGLTMRNYEHVETLKISHITTVGKLDSTIFIVQLEENRCLSLLVDHEITLMVERHRFKCKGISLQHNGQTRKLVLELLSKGEIANLRTLISTRPTHQMIEIRHFYYGILIAPILEVLSKV